MVLWTRLAPLPLHPDPAAPGGMPPEPRTVRWQVAEDERFRRVARSGSVTARPEFAHAVHVEVTGLRPGAPYYYRFRAGTEISAAGRTRTAPAPHQAVALRFAVASCQNLEHGHYTAYRHLAAEDVDLVLHLGDYIYERSGDLPGSAGPVRPHRTPEPVDLAGYRLRHAEYRLDPGLQAAHAAAPWIATWDDHDVVNNYAGDRAAGMDTAAFLIRRAAAYRAYYEHLPLCPGSVPHGAALRLFRRLSYGSLASFTVLDSRQYRHVPAAADGSGADAPREDPRRSLLGFGQEQWLIDQLARSSARWDIVAQPVFFAQRIMPGRDAAFRMDTWDGFPAARTRVLGAIAAAGRPRGPVVVTGDAHSGWAADLKADFDDPGSAILGAELVGTSISSGGDGSERRREISAILAANPHLRFFDNRRGYLLCTVTHQAVRADFRVLPFVRAPGAPVSTRASFLVSAERPGLQQIASG